MKGGSKFYRGSGRGARAYVESDHHRADDYYLSEGDGIAEMIAVDGRTGEVTDRLQLDGDAYESWVEGVDVRTGLDKGNLRRDEHALRFVEVIVNGPKSWSLAAGLHGDISAALDRAQHRAVGEIGRYLATNVCTRVGPRGQQRQVHVDALEMAVIRHFTSRGGDPHRHLHLQVNARVRAAGKWRGIDSAQLLRMQRAINGIGQRAVVADPEFRAALAGHGYTLNPDGEIQQLAAVVPAMSKRSAQVAANIERYERQWRTENPGQQPGPRLQRAWDERAWADHREAKKNHPTRGPDCEHAWLTELQALGVDIDAHRTAPPVAVEGVAVGAVGRVEAADRALKVLGAGSRGRSTWNVHDIRGVVEEVLASRGVIAEPAVFAELSEDVTARAIAGSVTVLDRPVPDHIRHLTSPAVIELERDLHGRLAVRAGINHEPATVREVAAALARLSHRDGTGKTLGEGQVAAVRAMAGTGPVVLVEGAAGAGKTTVLAAASEVLTNRGNRMVVVAPSKKAALVAAEQVQADGATTAAGVAWQHGFRWDPDGVWTRLRPGDPDPGTGQPYTGPHPTAELAAGDTLVVDEAGMLDQETARALLHIADEQDTRMVFLGDRQQLPAVGRGGVLDMVARWAPVQVELAAVHRFRTPGGGVDTEYADLSLRMRSGIDPAAVFDDLHRRGQVRWWPTEEDALANLAVQAAHRHLEGVPQCVSVATNDDAAAVNEVVREQLVNAGAVDDTTVVHGSDGLRIGAGDQVMTRQNNPDLGVANRMTWTVTGITNDGGVQLRHPNNREHTEVPADYVRHHLHLAYASTVHGAQGQTVDHADTTLGDGTDAAALYVAMTRGRHGNTIHITATSLDDARDQWVTAAGRNRADLGLDQARATATAEAGNYVDPDDDRGRWLREAANRIRRGEDPPRVRPTQLAQQPDEDELTHRPGSPAHVQRGPRL